MSNRSRVALKVHDIAASAAFFVECLGWAHSDEQVGADLAMILDPDERSPLLLAGPTVEDVSSLLIEPRIVLKPGDTIPWPEKDLDARLADLAKHGLTDMQQGQTDEGDRTLAITAPSGYIIRFIQRKERSPEETLAIYARGGEDVEETLAGLSEADFDLTRGSGEWSIREIVHHLAESESLFLLTLKTALAQSGSTYIRNPYDQALWVKELAYSQRAIEPSLALIRATRLHCTHLIQHIPDYSERNVFMKFADDESEGSRVTVRGLLEVLNLHLAEHCKEIRQAREVHGR